MPSSTRPYDRSASYGRMRASRRGVTGPRLFKPPETLRTHRGERRGQDRTSHLRAIHFGITSWQVYALAEWRIRLAPTCASCAAVDGRLRMLIVLLVCIRTILLAGMAWAQGFDCSQCSVCPPEDWHPHQTCSNMSVRAAAPHVILCDDDLNAEPGLGAFGPKLVKNVQTGKARSSTPRGSAASRTPRR